MSVFSSVGEIEDGMNTLSPPHSIVDAEDATAPSRVRGAVDFEVLKSWAPWLVLGDAIGVVLAGRVDGHVLLLIFAVGVLLMSSSFLVPRLSGYVLSDSMPGLAPRAAIAGGLGTFSSLLGIGGGTIAIMVMTLCGRSIHRAIATASGIGVLIAIPSAIGFAIIGFREPGLELRSQVGQKAGFLELAEPVSERIEASLVENRIWRRVVDLVALVQ